MSPASDPKMPPETSNLDWAPVTSIELRETLERNYLAYLAAINAKDWTAVATFAQPTVTHNEKSYSNIEYARMIKETSAPFAGIRFVAERLTIDTIKSEIACRIRFEWNGEPFYELVMYQLQDGKISQVWSIVQLPKEDRDSA